MATHYSIPVAQLFKALNLHSAWQELIKGADAIEFEGQLIGTWLGHSLAPNEGREMEREDWRALLWDTLNQYSLLLRTELWVMQ